MSDQGNPLRDICLYLKFPVLCFPLLNYRFINRRVQEKLIVKVIVFPVESQEMVSLSRSFDLLLSIS